MSDQMPMQKAAGALRRLALACGTALLASTATAQDSIVSHGVSTFGDLHYPADMAHLDYVNPDAPKGGEISVWAAGTFDSMNPYTTKGRAGALSNIMFESILAGTADEIGAAYCFLCTTLEYPEDKSWVIFNLRDDVTFADGTPMTADDVLFTYEIFQREGLASFRAVLAQQVTGAEVLDTHRIRFDFHPDAPRRSVIQSAGGLPIFSKAWFEETGAGLDESRMQPALGTGAYQLDRYDVNARVIYRRNPDYWGADHPLAIGQNNFDTIRVEYFGDSAAAFEGFKAGTYTFRQENSSKDWATSYDFPALQLGTYVKEELPNGTIAPAQSFVFNLQREKFADPRVREAIGLMFNFEWSNESLFHGLYQRVHSFWENSELAATGTPSDAELALLQPLVDEGLLDAAILTDEVVLAPTGNTERQLDRNNLRRASALLDDAGWTVGVDGKRRNDAGQLLSIEFLEDSPAFDRIINPFIENLAALGVDARLSRVDPAQYTDRTRGKDFDIITDQFPLGYEPGPGLFQYFGSEGAAESTFNSPTLQNEAVDRLITAVTRADNRDDMLVAVHALDRVLRSLRFWIPQFYNDKYFVSYLDIYAYPDPLPPYALGHLEFWWQDPAKAEAMRAAGNL
ncbi:MAG: extracellular solute-binding protein [Paracoccaceae bacterium]